MERLKFSLKDLKDLNLSIKKMSEEKLEKYNLDYKNRKYLSNYLDIVNESLRINKPLDPLDLALLASNIPKNNPWLNEKKGIFYLLANHSKPKSEFKEEYTKRFFQSKINDIKHKYRTLTDEVLIFLPFSLTKHEDYKRALNKAKELQNDYNEEHLIKNKNFVKIRFENMFNEYEKYFHFNKFFKDIKSENEAVEKACHLKEFQKLGIINDLTDYIRNFPNAGNANIDKQHRNHLANILNRSRWLEENLEGLLDKVNVKYGSFIDNLVDITEGCVFGPYGSHKEAAIAYSMDPSIQLLCMKGKNYDLPFAKAIMAKVKGDKGETALLVDGVLINSFIQKEFKDEFEWEYLFLRGIIKAANSQNIEKIIINTDHSSAQQCTHDFVRFCANYMGYKQNIDYTFDSENEVNVFKLAEKRMKLNRDNFYYTHWLEKEPMPQKIVSVLSEGGYDYSGQQYLDFWYPNEKHVAENYEKLSEETKKMDYAQKRHDRYANGITDYVWSHARGFGRGLEINAKTFFKEYGRRVEFDLKSPDEIAKAIREMD